MSSKLSHLRVEPSPSPARVNNTAKSSTLEAAPSPARIEVVTLTLEQLRAVVCDAIAEALGSGAREAPVYRDRKAEAERLSVHVSTLDRMCREGLPFVVVGDSRRFRAAEVDAYLRNRKAEAAE